MVNLTEELKTHYDYLKEKAAVVANHSPVDAEMDQLHILYEKEFFDEHGAQLAVVFLVFLLLDCNAKTNRRKF